MSISSSLVALLWLFAERGAEFAIMPRRELLSLISNAKEETKFNDATHHRTKLGFNCMMTANNGISPNHPNPNKFQAFKLWLCALIRTRKDKLREENFHRPLLCNYFLYTHCC